jgi:hypothetical protein
MSERGEGKREKGKSGKLKQKLKQKKGKAGKREKAKAESKS